MLKGDGKKTKKDKIKIRKNLTEAFVCVRIYEENLRRKKGKRSILSKRTKTINHVRRELNKVVEV